VVPGLAALKAARAGGIAVDAGRGLDGLRDLERGIDVVDDFRGGSRSVAALDAVGDVERSLDTVRNVDGARGGVRSVDGASDAAGGVRQVERSVDAGSGGARVDGAACLLGAANSFVAGTRVEMADGSSKAIEDVEIGERVFARDPCTGEQGSREVTHLIAGRGDKVLVDITVDGDTITATDAHPFWVVGPDQWRRADQLRSGDRLVTATGDTIVIDNVDIYRSVDRQVYNVTVADLHTYHVELDGHPVLTHNQKPKRAGCDDATEVGGRALELPQQLHHFATNKNSVFTPRMQSIADRYGLELDGVWNREVMAHLGRHPNAYHEFVLDGMEVAAREAGPDPAKFLELFEQYVKDPVRSNPELLRKSGWGN
jgi:hypothetical protein